MIVWKASSSKSVCSKPLVVVLLHFVHRQAHEAERSLKLAILHRVANTLNRPEQLIE